MTNPLLELAKLGQSVWLDYLSRDLMNSGELERLIRENGVSGLTSNPTIFEKAISAGKGYDAALKSGKGAAPADVFESLAVEDIQRAAEILRPVFDRTGGADGFVSLEVSPRLARDTKGTIEEARRLFKKVGRPNLMIKVPGTKEGLPAFRQLIGEGINVNVTLLFSVKRYQEVQESYMAGLETLGQGGAKLSSVASVASFFVSRVDTAVDALLSERSTPESNALLGRAAVANAKLAYQNFQAVSGGARWKALRAKGARPQRPLWASTSTKNPKYRDVIYVEELIGPETVNTMPQATVEAFRDHGKVRDSLAKGLEESAAFLGRLAGLKIDLDAVTQRLEEEGVQAFCDSYDKVLKVIESKLKVLV